VSNTLIRFGMAYYPYHWPETEWQRDLDQIRAVVRWAREHLAL
jgi:beta-galactosidase GanA